MAHIANLPLTPLMPPATSSSEIKEIAFKTVPSASKVEIKRVLESFYDLQVQKVRTLNVKGKLKHRGGSFVAKPDYKKAYVTLKKPISFSHDLYPSHVTANANEDSMRNKVLANQCYLMWCSPFFFPCFFLLKKNMGSHEKHG